MQRRVVLALLIVAFLVGVGHATLTTTVVSVATTPTQLVSAQPFLQDFAIANRSGGAAMFIGDSTVATGTGFQLDRDQTISFTALANTAVFGIVASGTEDAHVIRVN